VLRVVGIDPGLKVTGYGIVDAGPAGVSLVEAGVVSSRERDPMPERIRCIYEDMAGVLADASADVVAMEQLYAHYKHPRTAILMGHARGAIMLAAARKAVPVSSYSATRIKRSLTGNGHATKRQMQRMIQVTLSLEAAPEPPDVADALAVALCHVNAAGKPAAFARSRT
jgi:crossover junction endodeoxyribonuclease RuvC